MEPGRSPRVDALRRLFAPKDDPYAGADLANTRRLGSVVWLIGAVIAAVLMPIAPPTAAIGDAGWVIAGGVIAVSFAEARYIGRPGVGFGHMLLAGYIALAQLAVLQWLAGGEGTPYEQLYLLAFLYAATSQPPRRAAPCLAVGALVFLAPLAYDSFSVGALVSHLTQLLIWLGLSMVGMILMEGVRAQRLEGEAASRMARVDPLTSLGNRRAFEEAVVREIARARRNGESLSLLIADVDDFKSVNDCFGHQAGDECLRKVADALRLTVRVQDLCFRWAGDEFAALLPGSGAQGAEQVRARLLATVRAAAIGPDHSPLSISCGLAELEELMSMDGLVAMADLDLMLDKRGERVRA